jgi:hypothetical protein
MRVAEPAAVLREMDVDPATLRLGDVRTAVVDGPPR